MSDPAGPPHVRPRQSLSGRLWLLATLAVLLSEVAVFLPYIAHERSSWLNERTDDAAIAALAAGGAAPDPARAAELLRFAGVETFRMSRSGSPDIEFGEPERPPDATIDLREESLAARIGGALRGITLKGDRLIQVTDDVSARPGAEIAVTLRERNLTRALRQFAADFAGLALVVALVTGGLVYCAVLVLLVRPMRRITGSIAAFRADPEHARPIDPDDVAVLANDEIAVACQELSSMQHELRAALWRNVRLAAIGTVVAKVSHDLRGILTPALLTAERLQLNADPRVKRFGETVAQAVDRAADLVRHTLDYAREGPPSLQLKPVALAPLANEAAEAARLRMENRVEPAMLVLADRTQLFRVLLNLLRNAAEAGARLARLSAQRDGAMLTVEIADDGPGLPERVRAELFRPFAGTLRRGGSGLGLAIARDLMVAHGGSIELVATGDGGTTFRLALRLAEPAQGVTDGPPAVTPRLARATRADV